MIDFYTWTTPNGRKVSILLEECGLDYTVHTVDIGQGEQDTLEFRAVCPNGKIPAIVDRSGPSPVSIFESGAILIHLAERCGRFLPTEPAPRADVLQWLMWQMANVGPMFGQVNHFANQAPEQIPYAIERYLGESARLIRVMDDHLAEREYLAGDYSIADMATYPWMTAGFGLLRGMKGDVIGEGANVERWLGAVGGREAVVKGMAVPAA